MELWDILDENGNKTGRLVERGKPLNKGEYHLVIFVWIKNSNGQFLISKRSKNKPGAHKWEVPGGAAIAGEHSIDAALREVKEEIGIKLDVKEGSFIIRLKFDTDIPWFCDIWQFNDDTKISNLVLQEEEVADAKWASKEEIINLIQQKEFFNSSLYINNNLLDLIWYR